MTTHGRRCALGSVIIRVTATGYDLLIEGFPDSCTVLRRLAANVCIVCCAAELPKLVACWVRSLHLSAGCVIERIRYGFRAAEMTVGAQSPPMLIHQRIEEHDGGQLPLYHRGVYRTVATTKRLSR